MRCQKRYLEFATFDLVRFVIKIWPQKFILYWPKSLGLFLPFKMMYKLLATYSKSVKSNPILSISFCSKATNLRIFYVFLIVLSDNLSQHCSFYKGGFNLHMFILV